MFIRNKILTRGQLLKSLFGLIGLAKINHIKSNELVVLNYHGTQKKFIKNFKYQIDWLSKKFEFVPPSFLDYYYNSHFTLNDSKPYLLLTFDDGIKNNLNVLEILNDYNIKALFFVVPDFIQTKSENQKNYFIKNIRPNINPNIDENYEDFMAMSWKELKHLVSLGHHIAPHTMSHTLVSELSSIENSTFEIIQARKLISENLGLSIDSVTSYCCPNETLISTGKKEYKIIKNNYKYFFTTYFGSNIKDKDPLFIKRVNVECFWPISCLKFALSNIELKRWNKKIKKANQKFNI